MNHFKNRVVDYHKPVKVYRNLHKQTYSVLQDGVVVGHTDFLEMNHVEFVVQQAGRARAQREKKKNVHAFMCGYLLPEAETILTLPVKVSYTPYNNLGFTGNGEPITFARFVAINNKGVTALL